MNGMAVSAGSLIILALSVVLKSWVWSLPQQTSTPKVFVSVQLFYDELSPYGSWVDYPNSGYVWIPHAGSGFIPYATDGHWVFTDHGWTWVSDFSWGWATFHYGRWDYGSACGWFWVPDNEWGPAWVSWRRSPGYYGWTPLRPGCSLDMAFGSKYHQRSERWIFVGEEDMAKPDVSSHYINRKQNATLIEHSTVIVNTKKDRKRNVTYVTGPQRDDVEKITNAPVRSVLIRENDQPANHMSSGELNLYRPYVQKGNGYGRKPVPSKLTKLGDVRPTSERRLQPKISQD